MKCVCVCVRMCVRVLCLSRGGGVSGCVVYLYQGNSVRWVPRPGIISRKLSV